MIVWHTVRALTHRWPASSRPLRQRLHARVERKDRGDLVLVIKGPFLCAAATNQDVVFVGTRSPERERWIRTIADLGPKVYGNDWPSIPGVQIGPPIYGAAYREIASGAGRCSTSSGRRTRVPSNMRAFEIPGCGGMQVAEYIDEHASI